MQSGDLVFRYMLTSGRELDSGDLARLGRAAMTPLEIGHLADNDKFGNPDRQPTTASASFLAVDAANVTVNNWKVAEDGNGTVMRLLETGGTAAVARLSLPLFKIDRVWLADAAEENHEELRVNGHSVEVSLKPHESITLRILVKTAVAIARVRNLLVLAWRIQSARGPTGQLLNHTRWQSLFHSSNFPPADGLRAGATPIPVVHCGHSLLELLR